jgi:peptide-methionine (S)-S-oxide reductase
MDNRGENMSKLMYWFCFFGLSVVIGVGCLRQDEVLAKETVEQKILNESNDSMEISIIGGGCFWCTEAVFERIEGVKEVISGYAGGEPPNPTYKEICTGKTGHAEVIKIIFDPSIVSFAKVLEIFGECHDPTTLNRQGADVGTQYRSTIMYLTEEQKTQSIQWKEKLAAKFEDPIVTEIVPAPIFYHAEEYHQDYYKKNPNQGYCSFVIRPKLKKLNLE